MPVFDANRKDLETQGRFEVSYRTYWVDEKAGRVFCLVEPPDAAARTVSYRTYWVDEEAGRVFCR